MSWMSSAVLVEPSLVAAGEGSGTGLFSFMIRHKRMVRLKRLEDYTVRFAPSGAAPTWADEAVEDAGQEIRTSDPRSVRSNLARTTPLFRGRAGCAGAHDPRVRRDRISQRQQARSRPYGPFSRREIRGLWWTPARAPG